MAALHTLRNAYHTQTPCSPRAWFIFTTHLLCWAAQADRILGAAAAVDASVAAPAAVASSYAAATGKPASQGNSQAAAGGGPPPGEDCPICYEEMAGSGEATEACDTCTKHVHAECMRMWSGQQGQAHKLACVLCRAPWRDSAGAQYAGSAVDRLSPHSNSQLTHSTNLWLASAALGCSGFVRGCRKEQGRHALALCRAPMRGSAGAVLLELHAGVSHEAMLKCVSASLLSCLHACHIKVRSPQQVSAHVPTRC